MGQWVKCTLKFGEKMGEPKLVRHINLDYYVCLEPEGDGTKLVPASGGRELSVMQTPEEIIDQLGV